MIIVYVLKSIIAKKSYVGMTNDIMRRISEHNSGKHFYTKRYMPWQVIYTEKYTTIKEAREREEYLKTGSGRRFLKTLFV